MKLIFTTTLISQFIFLFLMIISYINNHITVAIFFTILFVACLTGTFILYKYFNNLRKERIRTKFLYNKKLN